MLGGILRAGAKNSHAQKVRRDSEETQDQDVREDRVYTGGSATPEYGAGCALPVPAWY